jgi:hypothetical protein
LIAMKGYFRRLTRRIQPTQESFHKEPFEYACFYLRKEKRTRIAQSMYLCEEKRRKEGVVK